MTDNGTSQGNTPTSSTTDTCPICGSTDIICAGLGLVRYAVPVDDPRFGQLFRCPNNPAELDDAWQERLRRSSNLGVFQHKTFNNFDVDILTYTDSERHSLRLARDTAWRFAENPDGWLLLSGTYGCGKTHLAAAVGNTLLDQGDDVMLVTVPDLLDHLRSTYGPSSEISYDDMFERLRNVSRLILDDLGVENPSAWAHEKLFQLLDHRYARKLTTIITTNVEFERIDPRIRSRMMDSNLIKRVMISAPDYRSMARTTPDAELVTNLEQYHEMRFETFDLQQGLYAREQQNLRMIAEAAQNYAENPNGWFLLLGRSGVGKTHLAAAIAIHYQEVIGDRAMFVTMPDLLDYLRRSFAPNAPVSFGKRFQEVKTVPMLVLDAFDSGQPTPWAQEKMFQLLDYRYVNRLPTVLTAIQNVDEFPERIATRLLDDRLCAIFAITAEPYSLRRRRK